MNTTMPLSSEQKILGSLLGGAVGDALGAPIEFMSLGEIRAKFGPGGLLDYVPAYGRLGAITDDTQMTLFTAEGLLRAFVRGRLRGVASITSVVSHAYLRWLWTQGIESEAKPKPSQVNGWLWTVKGLHSQRAPGRTCIYGLKALKTFTDKRADNDSKGAGGIMRVAPVAMMFANQPDEVSDVFRLGKEMAWLTHGHPTGFLSAAVFAVILHGILCGETLLLSIALAREFLLREADHEETLLAMDRAMQLADAGIAADEALPQLGDAWVGEEALAVAIYCALMAESFQDGVLMAVNHDGDSDTTGSLVGQLLGAIHGERAILGDWLASLELRDTIEQLGRDIAGCRSWNLDYMSDDYDEAIVKRYPGG